MQATPGVVTGSFISATAKLSLLAADDGERGNLAQTPPTTTGQPTVVSARDGTAILWIEDDGVVAQWGAECLTSGGFSVEVVADGPSGLARALERRHNLIVMDWRLPYLGGETVLRFVRAARITVPVLVCTGFTADDEELAAYLAGADDFLKKPFLPTELEGRIERLLDIYSGSYRPAPYRQFPSSLRHGQFAPPVDVEPHLRRFERWQAWHRRLLMGDTSAQEEIAREFLPALRTWLRRRTWVAEAEWAHDASVDALLELFRRPTAYDPLQGTLIGFLRLIAGRRAANRRRGLWRRLQHELTGCEDLPEPTVGMEDFRPNWPRLRSLFRECETPHERRFLSAWLRGASLDQLAELAGVAGLPVTAQRQAVHRLKSRLRQRFRRHLREGSRTG